MIIGGKVWWTHGDLPSLCKVLITRTTLSFVSTICGTVSYGKRWEASCKLLFHSSTPRKGSVCLFHKSSSSSTQHKNNMEVLLPCQPSIVEFKFVEQMRLFCPYHLSGFSMC